MTQPVHVEQRPPEAAAAGAATVSVWAPTDAMPYSFMTNPSFQRKGSRLEDPVSPAAPLGSCCTTCAPSAPYPTIPYYSALHL